MVIYEGRSAVSHGLPRGESKPKSAQIVSGVRTIKEDRTASHIDPTTENDLAVRYDSIRADVSPAFPLIVRSDPS